MGDAEWGEEGPSAVLQEGQVQPQWSDETEARKT